MLISMMSPFLSTAISPPAAASGETWHIESPDVPPENLSVGDERALLVEVL